jgi:hypothetical protein
VIWPSSLRHGTGSSDQQYTAGIYAVSVVHEVGGGEPLNHPGQMMETEITGGRNGNNPDRQIIAS